MCLIGVKETYVQGGKKWQKTFWVKFALPYPALKYEHPVLVQILELYKYIWIWPKMGRRLSLFRSPAMWALEVIQSADSAAKDALVGDISVELIPFSNLKPCTDLS